MSIHFRVLDDPTSIKFQSKDTDSQYCEEYVVTTSGRLIYHKPTRYEDRSDKTAPEGSFLRLLGCATPVEFEDIDTNYSGVLNIYGDRNSGQLRVLSTKPENFLQDIAHPLPCEWFEYDLWFENGALVRAERLATS